MNSKYELEYSDESKKFKYAIIFEMFLRGFELLFNILIMMF